jgi:hypothetical protein
MKKSHRLSGIILIALILTVATFAFAAANTLPATTSAGDGDEDISGYTISNIDYILDGTNPSLISQVEFDITPTGADNISIKLIDAGSTWYSCTEAAGAVTCPITGGGVAALTVDNLRVIAAD